MLPILVGSVVLVSCVVPVTSFYYSHPSTWDKAISKGLYQVELSVVSDSCICEPVKGT